MASSYDAGRCRWTSQSDALAAFSGFAGLTQSAGHIKPLHWYVACRLVVEGGFDPDDVTPRPPFELARRSARGGAVLRYAEASAKGGEQTVLGGLKTKKVDVVVTRRGIGPVLAVSCKGVTGAFRNLTNRLEETVGECTNLHVTYPALVLGYLVVLRANQDSELSKEQLESAVDAAPDVEPVDGPKANDVAVAADGRVVRSIERFHNALSEMQGRRGIRNDVSRYEAIGLGLAGMNPSERGRLVPTYPTERSPLHLDKFFRTLYRQYDERFVTRAPDLESTTRRYEWAADSPGLSIPGLDYEPRIAGRTALDEAVGE